MKKHFLFIMFVAIWLLSAHTSVAAKTYAVVCGVSKYSTQPLRYPDDDAAAFYSWLLSVGTVKENITLLLNEQATTSATSSAINAQFGKATTGDVVIFYFSGHGTKGAFLTYGSEKDGKMLTHSSVQAAFKKSTASHKLCFADACHAGTLLVPDGQPEEDFAFEDATTDEFDGSVAIMMSSRSDETSLENQSIKSGLFTYFLLKGLKGNADTDKDKSITISELFSYLSQNVVSNSKGKQHPTLAGKFSRSLVLSKVKN
jgi:uncharacterized caspase-like protein